MDRNDDAKKKAKDFGGSLSARRAWIEIATSIDTLTTIMSLSARRAWIEIGQDYLLCCKWSVALRKESVDRNIAGADGDHHARRRSPQGERG